MCCVVSEQDGAAKRARVSETGAEPSADEPAAKRQHSRQGSHDEQGQQLQEAADAVHAPGQVDAVTTQQSPHAEEAGQPVEPADAYTQEAAAPDDHNTPFAAAAVIEDPGNNTAAVEEAPAAAAVEEAAAAEEASDGVPAAAAAGAGKGRSRAAARQLPAAQPSRPRRQLSKVESSKAAAAAKQPSREPARPPNKKDVKKEKLSQEEAEAFTQKVWGGFHGTGSEDAGWGDGRKGTQGEACCAVCFQDRGEACCQYQY